MRWCPPPVATDTRPSNTHRRMRSFCCAEFSVWLGSLQGQPKRGLQGACKPRAPRGPAQLVSLSHTIPSVSFLGFLKGVPLKRAVSPSCLGPTQQLSDSQEGGWRCPPRWALAPVSTGKREPPVPHVMGARGLPRPDASAQTFPKLALSSKSWLKNSASRASTASSPPNSNRRALPVTWPHLSTHLQPSITTCKTTGFWLQFIENKGLKCWL